MNRLLPILLLLTTTTYGQSINTTTQVSERNIYNDAIKQYMSFASGSDKSNPDTLLILKDDNITDCLLTKIKKSQIIILDSTEISNRLKRDISFTAHKLFPLNFDQERFYIHIVPFRLNKNIDEVIFENNGTYVVRYLYNNSSKQFTFYRVSCNGL